MDPFTIEGSAGSRMAPDTAGGPPVIVRPQFGDDGRAVALTVASPAAAFNVSNAQPVRSHHDQLVRSLAEYRLSSAISFEAALGARTPLVTISRFSSFLP